MKPPPRHVDGGVDFVRAEASTGGKSHRMLTSGVAHCSGLRVARRRDDLPGGDRARQLPVDPGVAGIRHGIGELDLAACRWPHCNEIVVGILPNRGGLERHQRLCLAGSGERRIMISPAAVGCESRSIGISFATVWRPSLKSVTSDPAIGGGRPTEVWS